MKQTWTATTIAEAINLLDAATRRLEAQALALEPGSYSARKEIERVTPVLLTLNLDLTEAELRTATKHLTANTDLH